METEAFYMYEVDSLRPLRPLGPKDLEIGKLVYISTGECFKCESEEGGHYNLVQIHESVMNPGELLEDLSDGALVTLFWPLSHKELQKALKYEAKNTRKGEKEVLSDSEFA